MTLWFFTLTTVSNAWYAAFWILLLNWKIISSIWLSEFYSEWIYVWLVSTMISRSCFDVYKLISRVCFVCDNRGSYDSYGSQLVCDWANRLSIGWLVVKRFNLDSSYYLWFLQGIEDWYSWSRLFWDWGVNSWLIDLFVMW